MANNLTGGGRVGRGISDWICCDVDGTLLIWPTRPGGATNAEIAAARRNVKALSEMRPDDVLPEDRGLVPTVNWELVREIDKWLTRRKGVLVIWTMGGQHHAKLAMECCGFDHRWVICIAKPDLIIDDAGHDKLFARHRAIFPHEFKCPEA